VSQLQHQSAESVFSCLKAMQKLVLQNKKKESVFYCVMVMQKLVLQNKENKIEQSFS